MSALIRVVVATVALVLAANALAAGEVIVKFKDPDQFTDASEHYLGSDEDTQQTLEILRTHLLQLGTRALADGQTLTIEITDVDLAGRFEPTRAALDDVRILTDITWPRIELDYTLSSQGKVTDSGKKRLIDQNYLSSSGRYADSEELRYEKRLLDRWFAATFTAGKP